jgi:hypothetical protein
MGAATAASLTRDERAIVGLKLLSGLKDPSSVERPLRGIRAHGGHVETRSEPDRTGRGRDIFRFTPGSHPLPCLQARALAIWRDP